jgi:hypothetical protein
VILFDVSDNELGKQFSGIKLLREFDLSENKYVSHVDCLELINQCWLTCGSQTAQDISKAK